MRILVTGSDGQLGNCLKLASANSANTYIFTDVDDIDITDAEAVRLGVAANDFEVIVNCAAFTDVEQAEKQEDIASLINGRAVADLAVATKQCGATMIHISTDYVFDGKSNTPISEDAPTAPRSAYGRTKLLGEQAIMESGCKALIIRTAWLYSEFGRNFVKTMLKLTSEHDEIKVVADQIGSPTYARDLADAIVQIIDSESYKGREGVYHFTDEGVCSWFDLAKMTAEISSNDQCRVDPCRTSEYPSAVDRPAYSVLDKSKIKSTFGIEIPYWVDSLRKCISNIKND